MEDRECGLWNVELIDSKFLSMFQVPRDIFYSISNDGEMSSPAAPCRPVPLPSTDGPIDVQVQYLPLALERKLQQDEVNAQLSAKQNPLVFACEQRTTESDINSETDQITPSPDEDTIDASQMQNAGELATEIPIASVAAKQFSYESMENIAVESKITAVQGSAEIQANEFQDAGVKCGIRNDTQNYKFLEESYYYGSDTDESLSSDDADSVIENPIYQRSYKLKLANVTTPETLNADAVGTDNDQSVSQEESGLGFEAELVNGAGENSTLEPELEDIVLNGEKEEASPGNVEIRINELVYKTTFHIKYGNEDMVVEGRGATKVEAARDALLKLKESIVTKDKE